MKNQTIVLSAQFKKQTTKAVAAIALFACTYVLLFTLALVLTALCMYAGIALVVTIPRFITIALGIGLASLGILILIFLIKFLFKSNTVDLSHLKEIKRKDEPALFGIIDEIVREVGTSAPKRVYLSADINAAVFYDSNFWSMLFPVKKNLQIGIGLVNSVSELELKAILSHEFGHFSQRTMKVGSYVYHVNQVIFNMIYENESYERVVQTWSGITGYFAIFVILAGKIIQGIQWILSKLYEIVNKSYMGLSREMEFHADEIAANITGYEPLKNSLLRMELADECFRNVLTFYEEKIADSLHSENLYKEHRFAMSLVAAKNNLPMQQGLPEVTPASLAKFNKSKLVIKNQWASHPSTEERIARLEKANLRFEQEEYTPANNLFTNIENTQQLLTKSMFSKIVYAQSPQTITLDTFKEEYSDQFTKNTFSKIYDGYYDVKKPIPFLVDEITETAPTTTLETLFSESKIDIVYTVVALENDMQILQQIKDKLLPVKTFDYDGQKFKRKQSSALLDKLKLESDQLNEEIKANDIAIYKYFLHLEKTKGNPPKLKEMYKSFFAFNTEFEAKIKRFQALLDAFKFLGYTTNLETITDSFSKIKPQEAAVKKEISAVLEDALYQSEITKEMKENLALYLSKEWSYVGYDTLNETNLNMLFTAVNNYAFLLFRGFFLVKKELLQYQAALVTTSTTI